MPEFAFPDNQNPPPERAKGARVAQIAQPVRLKFRLPELQPGLGHARKFARGFSVAMPETTVDKDDGPAAGKDQVRLAGQARAVKPVSVTARVKGATNGELGFCVLGADTTHALGAFERGEGVQAGLWSRATSPVAENFDVLNA